MKKRASIKLGFVMSMQGIDEDTNQIVNDHVVNVWGASYERLEVEEAVLFEARLQQECGSDLMKVSEKAMKVSVDFGLETVMGIPPDEQEDNATISPAQPPRSNAR